jgi:hypothetical protein
VQIKPKTLKNVRHPKNARSLKKPDASPGFHLRGVAVVVVDNPTKNVATAHRSTDWATCFGDGNLLIDTLMRAYGVEEANVFMHNTP